MLDDENCRRYMERAGIAFYRDVDELLREKGYNKFEDLLKQCE